MKNNLSVTVITLNEEKNLRRCLESIKDIAGEIIVVDSGSTDDTLEIAKSFNAKIFHKKFINYAQQKNFAANKASGEWIFSIDGDEVVTDTLAKEIVKAISNKDISGYLIGRRNFILGAEIKHTRWSPDEHIWLWQKDKGGWVGEIHEEVEVKGSVEKLVNRKIHYQDTSISEFIRSNNKYSSMRADQLKDQKVRSSLLRIIYEPMYEFLLRFVYKLGFLDGWRGLVLSVLMAYYQFQVWTKLYKSQR